MVRHELGFSKTEKRFPRKDTCLAIYSHRVNTQRPLSETLDSLFPWCAEWEAELTRLYRAYVEKKLANQALDYDDLLLYWHAMMSDDRLAADIGAQFDHILVDEYQDTNVLQAEILQAPEADGDGVTVVGDDAQAIYSFRAATVENILGFPAQYTQELGHPASICHTGGKLSLHARGARRSQRVDRRRAAPVSKSAARHRGTGPAAIRHGRRRSGSGGIRRRSGARRPASRAWR